MRFARFKKFRAEKRLILIACVICIAFAAFFAIEVFSPKSFTQSEPVLYDIQRGVKSKEIAEGLENKGIIKNSLVFRAYAFFIGRYRSLQAGAYEFSPSMSIAAIVHKLTSGDVIKHKISIIAGWNNNTIADYLEKNNFYSKKEFLEALNQDYHKEFPFLQDKPKEAGLDGFLFPDTYKISANADVKDFVRVALTNTSQKFTLELRKEIGAKKKTIFEIITMASILEKEARTLDDKKIIAGILWKRIDNGMPLQVDATINYITGKSNPKSAIRDIKIDSPYNTYKYTGLPLGPIASPGMDSIIAAVHPKRSSYWYYLSSDKTGKIIFSATFRDHTIAMARHFR